MTLRDFLQGIGYGIGAAALVAGLIAVGYAATALIFFFTGQESQGLSHTTAPPGAIAGVAVTARAPALSPARPGFLPLKASHVAQHPQATSAGLDFFGETSRRESAAVQTTHQEAGPGISGITKRSATNMPPRVARRQPRRCHLSTKNARSVNCGRRMYPDELAKTSEARRMYQNTPQGAIKHGSARFRALAAWHDDIPFRDLRQRLNAAPRFPVIDGGRVERGGTGMRRAHRPARHGGGGPDHAA